MTPTPLNDALLDAAKSVLSDIDDDGIAELDDVAIHSLRAAVEKLNTRAEPVGVPTVQAGMHDLQIIDLAGGYSYTCGLGRVFKTDAELVRFVRQLPLQPSDATAQPSAGNWQQYAKEGESAQDVIERERKDSDALLTLLAKAREAAQPIDLTDEQIIEIANANGIPIRTGKTAIKFARALLANTAQGKP